MMNDMIGLFSFVGMVSIVLSTLIIGSRKPVGSREQGNVETVGVLVLMTFVLFVIPVLFMLFGEWPE